jgi:coproporphyrinogen III oxidase-like Fe-S oxidoreductase
MDNFMTSGVFHSALDYLERSGIKQLRILGGEPTIHPRFTEFVDVGIKRGFTLLIFSNGLMPEKVLNHLQSLDPRQLTVLLNTIHPVENNPAGVCKQQDTMRILSKRVKPGINLFRRGQTFEYLIHDILRYDLIREIRMGLAHPLLSRRNVYLHPEYYRETGIRISDFVEKAAHEGIKVGFDCGFVPCMFQQNSFQKGVEPWTTPGKSCNPILDLLPDGRFISCYPLNDFYQFPLLPQITSKQLVEIFEHKLAPFSHFGIFPHCRECSLFRTRCSGGCVSQKIIRLNREKRERIRGTIPDRSEVLRKAEILKLSENLDIGSRIPPKPYRPENGREILNEPEIIAHLKKGQITKEVSIYLHIPFCRTKCAFCDLYSFPLNHHNDHLKTPYVEAMIREIEFWGELMGKQCTHVTTIHFGGGSPMVLPHELLSKILATLKSYFPIDKTTEIALEITTDEISEENIRFFGNENISRIHTGIQTLSKDIRKIIGRNDHIEGVGEKIKELKKNHKVISADLLFGLPNQSPDGFLSDIHHLIGLGFDGFALYEFQPSKFIKRKKLTDRFFLPNKYENFIMLQNAKELLNGKKFHNVFYNHYGNERDKNLYFTFLQRKEDCISIGAISDGVVGGINFRHNSFNKYMNSVNQHRIGLDYGYRESAERSMKTQFEVALMSTKIPESLLAGFSEIYGDRFEKIFKGWNRNGMINESSGKFELSAGGCYFISTMIEEVRNLKQG